jgi:hypothetical protein
MQVRLAALQIRAIGNKQDTIGSAVVYLVVHTVGSTYTQQHRHASPARFQ